MNLEIIVLQRPFKSHSQLMSSSSTDDEEYKKVHTLHVHNSRLAHSSTFHRQLRIWPQVGRLTSQQYDHKFKKTVTVVNNSELTSVFVTNSQSTFVGKPGAYLSGTPYWGW